MSANDTHPPMESVSARRPLTVTSHPLDPATACSCDIQVETGPTGSILVVHVAGEVDMITIPLVQATLAAALDRAPRDLVIDLAGTGFCCIRGFELLADTAHTAARAGISFALSGLSPHLARVIALLWPNEHFVRYRSVAAAVTAIRVDQTYRPE